MANRVMLDTTHKGLPAAMSMIRALPQGDIIAGYDTGSPDIQWNAGDWAAMPTDLTHVQIDQAFTGSPNLNASIRDCENGAWTLAKAISKAGWLVPRPTLYLGFPDTVQQAFNAGWRGDVWIALSSDVQPTKPPMAPAGINIVAQQWNFTNPNYDLSVVFDPYWPKAKPNMVIPTPPPGQWHDPKQWTWQEAIIIGRGLDNGLYAFAFNPQTGLWVRQSLPSTGQV